MEARHSAETWTQTPRCLQQWEGSSPQPVQIEVREVYGRHTRVCDPRRGMDALHMDLDLLGVVEVDMERVWVEAVSRLAFRDPSRAARVSHPYHIDVQARSAQAHIL